MMVRFDQLKIVPDVAKYRIIQNNSLPNVSDTGYATHSGLLSFRLISPLPER